MCRSLNNVSDQITLQVYYFFNLQWYVTTFYTYKITFLLFFLNHVNSNSKKKNVYYLTGQ